MTKQKTKAQLDRATDQRLRKTYNISLEDYEYLLKLGNGGCWICQRPAGERRLHVDHDHAYKKVEIIYEKFEDGWKAWTIYNQRTYYGFGIKKSLASKELKRQLLRASIRGLLCYQHNAGLQKFSDSSTWLRSAGQYLENHWNKSPLTGRELK